MRYSSLGPTMRLWMRHKAHQTSRLPPMQRPRRLRNMLLHLHDLRPRQRNLLQMPAIEGNPTAPSHEPYHVLLRLPGTPGPRSMHMLRWPHSTPRLWAHDRR